jgi:DNA mismatch repair protein MutS
MDGYRPSELLVPRDAGPGAVGDEAARWRNFTLEAWAFTDDFARERLLRQFGTTSLKGFGLDDRPLAQRAAGAVLHYLGETHHDRLGHVKRIARLGTGGHVWLDRFTVRNLELVSPVNDGGRTLLQAMDACATPMGTRLLRRWLLFPLVDRAAID